MPEELHTISNPLCFQIVGLFFLAHSALVARYLWQKAGYTRHWIPVRPTAFLGAAAIAISLIGVFLLLCRPIGALYAVALGLNTVFALASPVASLSFLVTTLLMRPWELVSDPGLFFPVMLRFTALLAVASWIFNGMRKRHLAITWVSACTVFLLLLIWLTISALLSFDSSASLQLLFSSFFPVTVLFILILSVIRNRVDLQFMRDTVTLAIVGIITSGYFFAINDPDFGTLGFRLTGAGAGLLSDSNDMGALIVISLAFIVFSAFRSSAGLLTRMIGVATIGFLLIALWFTQSRGSFIACALAGSVYFFVRSKSKIKAAMLTLPLIVLPYLGSKFITRELSDLEGSRSARMNYMYTGFRMLKYHPIVGVGIGNYKVFYDRYTYAYYEQGRRTAHSSWVLVMSEAGVPGLLLFTLFWGLAGCAAFRIRKCAPEYAVAFSGYTVCMTFLSHTYLFLPYFLAALSFSAARALAPPTSIPQEANE